MDIEEVLAGLVAALRAGSTFAMVIQNDSEVQHNRASNIVNTKLIYSWLYAQCLPKNRVVSDAHRKNIEKHMHIVSENLMAAYELSNTLGCTMATCVEATAASYHAQRRAEDLRADVSAMPESTIKLLTALPVLALLAGELIGGNPIVMLLCTTQGWVLLTVGAICYGLGLVWVRSMLRVSHHAMTGAIARS